MKVRFYSKKCLEEFFPEGPFENSLLGFENVALSLDLLIQSFPLTCSSLSMSKSVNRKSNLMLLLFGRDG